MIIINKENFLYSNKNQIDRDQMFNMRKNHIDNYYF